MGRLLRSITDAAPRANTESYTVKESLAAGEMAPEKAINTILETNLKQLSDKAGVIIDGYPRNMQQVKYFEDKVKSLSLLTYEWGLKRFWFFWAMCFINKIQFTWSPRDCIHSIANSMKLELVIIIHQFSLLRRSF